MTASGGREGLSKKEKTHGHGQQRGDCRGRGGTRGLNGNGKNTIKIIEKNNRLSFIYKGKF